MTLAVDRSLDWPVDPDRRGVAVEPRRSWASPSPSSFAGPRTTTPGSPPSGGRGSLAATSAARSAWTSWSPPPWRPRSCSARSAPHWDVSVLAAGVVIGAVLLVALTRGYDAKHLGDGPEEFQSVLRAGAYGVGMLVALSYVRRARRVAVPGLRRCPRRGRGPVARAVRPPPVPAPRPGARRGDAQHAAGRRRRRRRADRAAAERPRPTTATTCPGCACRACGAEDRSATCRWSERSRTSRRWSSTGRSTSSWSRDRRCRPRRCGGCRGRWTGSVPSSWWSPAWWRSPGRGSRCAPPPGCRCSSSRWPRPGARLIAKAVLDRVVGVGCCCWPPRRSSGWRRWRCGSRPPGRRSTARRGWASTARPSRCGSCAACTSTPTVARRAGRAERRQRRAVQDARRPAGHAGRARSCAATPSTSCPSCSTWCAATCRWSARARRSARRSPATRTRPTAGCGCGPA